MDWHAQLKQRLRSNRNAAEVLHPLWHERAPEEVEHRNTTPQALANKLGTLARDGDPTGWWAARPALQELLAAKLGLHKDDIFGAPNSHAAATHGFPEFPALPPLAAHEQPCVVATHGSVFQLALRAATTVDLTPQHLNSTWIVAPPGAGKGLAISLLTQRHSSHVDAQRVTHLRDALAIDEDPRTLVVRVDQCSPHDADALRAVTERRPRAIVLAAFPPPCPVASHFEVEPLDQWIDAMLAWVDQRRSSDEPLKPTVRKWLDSHPEIANAVQTPGELLALCAAIDARASGTRTDLATLWLEVAGRRMLPAEVGAAWREHAAVPCIEKMARAHLLDCSCPFDARSLKRWADVVSHDSLPGDGPGRDVVIASLRSGGLLRQHATGATLYPQWCAASLTHAATVAMVRAGEVETWGQLASDKSRQPIVDAVLDRLPRSHLDKVATSVLEPSGLASIAALEAVAAALARRLVDNPNSTLRDVASRALRAQLPHLMRSPAFRDGITSLTRPDRAERFVTGWAITLAVSAPPNFDLPPELRLFCPGWVKDLTLDELQRAQLPMSGVSPWGASAEVARLSKLGPQLIQRLQPHTLPERPPRLLLPAFFLSHEWAPTGAHLEQLRGTWDEVALADAARDLPDRKRRQFAERLWELAARTGTTVAHRLYGIGGTPALEAFLFEHLDEKVVEETSANHGTHEGADARWLLDLPKRLRAAAIRGIRQRDDETDAHALLTLVDGEVVDDDDLITLLEEQTEMVHWSMMERVWQAAPDRSLAVTRRLFEANAPEAMDWFTRAPRAMVGELVDLAVTCTSPPTWLRDWAIWRIIDAGPHAEKLYTLARSLPPDHSQ